MSLLLWWVDGRGMYHEERQSQTEKTYDRHEGPQRWGGTTSGTRHLVGRRVTRVCTGYLIDTLYYPHTDACSCHCIGVGHTTLFYFSIAASPRRIRTYNDLGLKKWGSVEDKEIYVVYINIYTLYMEAARWILSDPDQERVWIYIEAGHL